MIDGFRLLRHPQNDPLFALLSDDLSQNFNTAEIQFLNGLSTIYLPFPQSFYPIQVSWYHQTSNPLHSVFYLAYPPSWWHKSQTNPQVVIVHSSFPISCQRWIWRSVHFGSNLVIRCSLLPSLAFSLCSLHMSTPCSFSYTQWFYCQLNHHFGPCSWFICIMPQL